MYDPLHVLGGSYVESVTVAWTIYISNLASYCSAVLIFNIILLCFSGFMKIVEILKNVGSYAQIN